MLHNFPSYNKLEIEKQCDILDEINKLKFQKNPCMYSADLIRYALLLGYSSVHSYNLLLDEFKLP